jgi:predicted lipoprotein with Yx(FWY)xxD motif
MRPRLTTLVATLSVAVLIGGCSSDDDNASTDTSAESSTSTTRAEPESTVMEATTSSVPAADASTASNPLGDILVDAEGMTLYVFLTDTAGVSTCVDSCAQAWPPLVVTAVSVESPLTATDFSLVARSDGTQQLAVNGRPLYRFAGDAKPGDTAGQGLNGVWYVADANGEPIDDSATGD